MIKNRYFPLLILAIAGAVALPYMATQGHAPARNSLTSSEVRAWEERIHSVGPEAAYAEFSQTMTEIPEIHQHFHAHAFGEALYSVSGPGGFSTCDDRFAYGCAHEFIAKAIHEKGAEGLSTIASACPQNADFGKAFGCFHGIGHGLMADGAYEMIDLSKTLTLCSTLGNEAKHCYDGAFMEYNMHTMLSGGASVRDPKEPFAPCDTLDEKYQRYCFFRQAQWWQVALFGGQPKMESFKKMGALCRQQQEKLSMNNDDACMAGLGTTALGNSLEDLETVRKLCNIATLTKHENGVCLAFAAAIRNVIYKAGDGSSLCSSLTSTPLSLCLLGAEHGVEALMKELN